MASLGRMGQDRHWGRWLEHKNETAVAIVGTRQPTDRSLRFSEILGMELAERGLTMVQEIQESD